MVKSVLVLMCVLVAVMADDGPPPPPPLMSEDQDRPTPTDCYNEVHSYRNCLLESVRTTGNIHGSEQMWLDEIDNVQTCLQEAGCLDDAPADLAEAMVGYWKTSDENPANTQKRSCYMGVLGKSRAVAVKDCLLEKLKDRYDYGAEDVRTFKRVNVILQLAEGLKNKKYCKGESARAQLEACINTKQFNIIHELPADFSFKKYNKKMCEAAQMCESPFYNQCQSDQVDFAVAQCECQQQVNEKLGNACGNMRSPKKTCEYVPDYSCEEGKTNSDYGEEEIPEPPTAPDQEPIATETVDTIEVTVDGTEEDKQANADGRDESDIDNNNNNGNNGNNNNNNNNNNKNNNNNGNNNNRNNSNNSKNENNGNGGTDNDNDKMVNEMPAETKNDEMDDGNKNEQDDGNAANQNQPQLAEADVDLEGDEVDKKEQPNAEVRS